MHPHFCTHTFMHHAHNSWVLLSDAVAESTKLLPKRPRFQAGICICKQNGFMCRALLLRSEKLDVLCEICMRLFLLETAAAEDEKRLNCTLWSSNWRCFELVDGGESLLALAFLDVWYVVESWVYCPRWVKILEVLLVGGVVAVLWLQKVVINSSFVFVRVSCR